jgi:hypothetical protein
LNGIDLDILRPEDFVKEFEAIKKIIDKIGKTGEL